MLKYTLAAKDKILKDLRLFSSIFRYCSLFFTIGYFAYVLAMQKGIFIVNVILAGLFIVYTIFDIATCKKQLRVTRKVVKRTYDIIKLSMKGFTLGVSIYTIYITASDVTPISIILTTLLIILWIIQILFEVIVIVLEEELELLMAGINEDIVKPYTTISNVVSKFTGGEKQTYTQPYPNELRQLQAIVDEKEKDKLFKKQQKKKERSIMRKIFKK